MQVVQMQFNGQLASLKVHPDGPIPPKPKFPSLLITISMYQILWYCCFCVRTQCNTWSVLDLYWIGYQFNFLGPAVFIGRFKRNLNMYNRSLIKGCASVSGSGCFCCLLHPISQATYQLKHCKSSVLPSYTIRTQLMNFELGWVKLDWVC